MYGCAHFAGVDFFVGECDLRPHAGEGQGSAICGDAVCGGGAGMSEVRQILTTIVATLREIFDESAYMRFLARNRISSSSTAYAAFLREQEGIKARRPKCC